MLQAFTRNYEDNSTDAGFQFTFYCDICNDGYKSSFHESNTYKKRGLLRGLGEGASILGSLAGGKLSQLGYSGDRASNAISQIFEGKSPEWQKEHEQAFIQAQNEAQGHFHRCPNCNKYVCSHCFNEEEGLCTGCAPRTEVYVAKAHSQAIQRNIDEKAETATVWTGELESKTTICPTCGKPAGGGKFCNNCGANLELKTFPKCGSKNAQTVRFCNNCGENLSQPSAPPSGKCSACGFDNPPGTKFCGGCGNKLTA